MAQLITFFDATQISPEFGAGMLPVGRHDVVIVASDIKATKDGNNQFLELILRVTGGENNGAQGAYRLNLYHTNDKTREIAQKELSRICHAINVLQVQNTEQLHNAPFIVEVELQKGSETMTEVKRVFAAGTPAPAAYAGPSVGNSGFTQPQQQKPLEEVPSNWGGQQQQQPQQQQQQPQQQQQQPQQQYQQQPQQQPQQQQQGGWVPPAQQGSPAAAGWTPAATQDQQAVAPGAMPWATK